MLNSINIKIVNKSVKKEDLKGRIQQKENKRLLGLRLFLGVYNLSDSSKHNWFQKYLRSIGEEPVIYDPYLISRSLDQLRLFMNQKGFYNSVVSDSVRLKDKKADVLFTIIPSYPYRIRHFSFAFEDTTLKSIILSDSVNTLIKRKQVFDEEVLKNERIRIETFLKNKGYYQFSRELISYFVDTTLNMKLVDVKLVINDVQKLQGPPSILNAYKPYKINNVTITNEIDFSKNPRIFMRSVKKDTISKNGVEFIYSDNFWVNPTTILQQNYLFPGAVYSQQDVEMTKKHLSALNTFGLINIYFDEVQTLDTLQYNYLNCHIRLTPLKMQSYSITGELTSSPSSSGSFYFGGDVGLNYQHRSLFGNAENLSIKVSVAKESVKNIDNTSNQAFNALTFSSEATITVPKFLFPIPTSPGLVKKYNPKTAFSIAFNYIDWPFLYERNTNFSVGYNWKIGPYISHSIKPIDFTFEDVHITDIAYYDSIIKPTYLVNSYTPQYILGSGYSFVFNNQNALKNRDYHYFKWNVDIAGNLLTLVNNILKSKRQSDTIYKNDHFYTLFGDRYSQYVRTDLEFVYNHHINENNALAYRIFGGIAIPYGNADATPLIKQYYSGGANGIRAWQPRYLGPGSYNGNIGNFPNNTGDIKLEGNIEYRFKLFWIFEGAVFNDAGNIWAITQAPTDKREGILFQRDKFYKDLAIGSGVGLRLNVTYFLIRLDVAVKTHNPAEDPGMRWIFQKGISDFTDMNYNIAIGYPF